MLQQLDADPYASLAQMRASEPVSPVPALDGWLVTRRDLCVDVMRDAELFTVDDPRFSTAPSAVVFRKPKTLRVRWDPQTA